MSKIIDDLADPTLLEALASNFAEEMACFGRSLPGAELHEDPELAWFITGPSRPNGVLQTHFAHTDRAYIDGRIRSTIDHFKARQIESMGWRVTPTASPPDLATYLQAHGFKHRAATDCMVLEISHLHEDIPVLGGLVITEVENEEMMQVKRTIEQRGFGASAQVAQDYYDVYMHSGFGAGTPWHHYIAWLHGAPVAMSSLLLHAGLAGIYGVATVPEARRQGIGAAITLHTVHEAARLGYHIATLSPTEMSLAIYRRIGFKEHCQIHHYALELK